MPGLFRIVFLAWTVAAMATGLLGILGYFGLTGGSFTLYDRAAGAFKDPNVFGPYLVLPATYLFHRLMSGNPVKMPLYVGRAFFSCRWPSFCRSRAAPGGSISSRWLPVTGALFIQSTSGAFRLRITVMAVFAALAIGIAATIALQIPAIADLFVAAGRQLVQEYDGARLRPLRALCHRVRTRHGGVRWGIGALVFGRMLWRGHRTTFGLRRYWT